MNIKKSIELMDKYGDCPDCGNKYISNGEGGVIIENNTFRRFCKCGFDITLDGDGNEIFRWRWK